MAFRGYGDQALDVKQNKRQEAVQRTQIAASERASQRSAGVQIANLNENARQADMANERAGQQLAATEADRADSRDLQREELAQRGTLHREDIAAAQGDRAADRAQNQNQHADDVALKSAESQRQERQLSMNEDTFMRMQEEVAKEKEVRDEWSRQDTAMELSVMRAAATLKPGEQLDPAWANKLNMFRGLKPGDPGYVHFITGVPDSKTGARYGVGYRKNGADGKPVDTILEPGDFIPKMRAGMSPDKWVETSQTILNNQTTKMGDAYSAIATRENRLHLQEQELKLKQAAAEVQKPMSGEAFKSVTADLKTIDTKIAKAGTKTEKAMLERQKADLQTAYDKERHIGAPAQASATAPGETEKPAANSPSVRVEGKSIIVEENGKAERHPDTPKLRDALEAMGYNL